MTFLAVFAGLCLVASVATNIYTQFMLEEFAAFLDVMSEDKENN